MIASVVMCRDENAYLREWCEWHYAIGFDRLLIFDDQSKVPLADTVRTFPYFLREVIEVHKVKISDNNRLQLTYLSIIVNLGSKYEWIAFIDTDEFIVPKRDKNIKTLLKRYRAYGGLVLNWQVFGSNGRLTRNKGSQIDSLIWKAAEDSPVNKHVKSIIQPSKVVLEPPGTPHAFSYIDGTYAVNCQRTKVDGPFSDPHVKIAQINHYLLRSREEYLEKAQRARPDTGHCVRDTRAFDRHDKEYSLVQDLAALKLKKELPRFGWMSIRTPPYLGI